MLQRPEGQSRLTFSPRSMNLTATSSLVVLSRISFATPKFPLPMSRICKTEGIGWTQSPSKAAQSKFAKTGEAYKSVSAIGQLHVDLQCTLFNLPQRYTCAVSSYTLHAMFASPLPNLLGRLLPQGEFPSLMAFGACLGQGMEVAEPNKTAPN